MWYRKGVNLGGRGGREKLTVAEWGEIVISIYCVKKYIFDKKKKPALLASISEDTQHVYKALVVYLHSWKHHVAVSRLSFQLPGKTVWNRCSTGPAWNPTHQCPSQEVQTDGGFRPFIPYLIAPRRKATTLQWQMSHPKDSPRNFPTLLQLSVQRHHWLRDGLSEHSYQEMLFPL